MCSEVALLSLDLPLTVDFPRWNSLQDLCHPVTRIRKTRNELRQGFREGVACVCWPKSCQSRAASDSMRCHHGGSNRRRSTDTQSSRCVVPDRVLSECVF